MAKAAQSPAVIHADTAWVATWNFDSGAPCSDTGWTKADNRILNDMTNYWFVSDAFQGQYESDRGIANITGKAAVLGVTDDCFASLLGAGYGNSWDQAIWIQYTNTSVLEFDAVLDTDFPDRIRIELDRQCICYNTNYEQTPAASAELCRVPADDFSDAYWNDAGRFEAPLSDFGMPNVTHCALIRFTSDLKNSPQDRTDDRQGDPWRLGAGVVIDNITVTTQGVTEINETFESWTGTCNPAGTLCFINSGNSAPFGKWARLFPHVTDNDVCTENPTCSWFFTDSTTITGNAQMSFGPGGAVIRNWLDNVIVSP